jgi:hypothetical protein
MKCTSRQPNSSSLCSGNGYVCNDLTPPRCICNSGWSSVGDFSLGSFGPECVINYRAVRIMSYLCIIIPAICSTIIIGHYVRIAMRKRSCYVITREYKTLFPLSFLIMGITQSIYGVLKVSYVDGQQPLIGRDISISLLVCIFTFFCFTGSVIYLHLIVEFLQRYPLMMTSIEQERISQRFYLIRFYSSFIPPAVLIISIMPLIGTAYPSRSKELGMIDI